ncbi:hypothetical protein SAMN05216404_11322 [Nitrosospira multiformis]|uniref:Sel1 repeat-containing protein n=1 Tax=Nitrosospira multiformis TaxID=1231 RepID=A0A1H8ML86_9PROT|nr:tetratricopeptide repeat protein [Nitrosospira multiformis]SEO18043.1 hypothetical protein SAMN05216404_11322 [Nitrosospira multiformis]
MFKFLSKFITLIILAILTSGCVAPGLELYQKALANQQAAYQQALDQQYGSHRHPIFNGLDVPQVTPTVGMTLEQQEQERQKAEMQRLAELQRQSKEGANEITIALAQKLLVGTLKGSTCDEKIGVEINLTGPHSRDRHILRANGTLRTFRQPEQSDSPAIETALGGSFDINTGVLNLRSVPKPPTREQIMEEQRRRQQAAAEIETKQREWEGEYIRMLQALPRMTPEERVRVRQENQIKENALKEEYYRVGKMNMQPLAPTPPPISLSMDIARDAHGRGWAGVIEGDGFNDCSEIVLATGGDSRTRELPPITGEVAYGRARPRGYAWPSIKMQIYWLNIAATQGYADANFALGQLYENQGQQLPQGYQRALQYYQAAANKGNAPAQAALSRMYANGWGIQRDTKESQRWAKLAESQYLQASKVCTAPKMIKEIDRLMKETRDDPAVKTLTAASILVGQMAVDLGTFRIMAITPEKFSSIDRPFQCTATASRSGARAKNLSTDSEHAKTGERLDKAVRDKIADVTTEMGKSDFKQPFKVDPLGNQLYKLTWIPQMLELSREYSVVVDLH